MEEPTYKINHLKGSLEDWNQYQSYFDFNERVANIFEDENFTVSNFTGSVAIIEQRVVKDCEWSIDDTEDKNDLDEIQLEVLQSITDRKNYHYTRYFLAFENKADAMKFKLQWLI